MGRSCGFTLAELVACLAISGALLALALPSMAVLKEESRLSNGLHALTGALASARVTAITRGSPVTLCPSSDGLRCRTDLDWSDGWILYRDPAGQPQPPEGAAVLLHQPLPVAGMSVRSTPGRHRVRFRPDGMAVGGNVTLRLCAGTPHRLRGEVVVSLSGRARVVRHARPGAPCPGITRATGP